MKSNEKIKKYKLVIIIFILFGIFVLTRNTNILNNISTKSQNSELGESIDVAESSSTVYISTLEELEDFRDDVNSGNTYEGITVYLENDIDMEGEEWTPIGNSSSYPFEGTFDGNGYELSGLYISETQIYVGLFGYNEGTIQNLSITDFNIEINSSLSLIYMGVIAGYNIGIIQNISILDSYCNVQLSSTGNGAHIGGVTGANFR